MPYTYTAITAVISNNIFVLRGDACLSLATGYDSRFSVYNAKLKQAMKAISLKAPGRAFNLPKVTVSGATLRRVSTFAAVAGTAGAWICAIVDRPVATCLCALLVTVCAAVNHSSKEGGEL